MAFRANACLQVRVRAGTLPAPWVSFGCYTYVPTATPLPSDMQRLSMSFLRDNTSSRTLKTAATSDVTNMTIEECIAFCTPTGYTFAGLEFGRVSSFFIFLHCADHRIHMTCYSTGML